ncbi:MAG TPA: hypothetical protein VMK42_10410 [Anaeromyxobacteraceae bacterium]|nr:hypothetical protein [Anaeromyxobacteraceae bacterium]
MKGHFLAAAAVAALALGASLLAGPARPPALLGSAIASATALASLYAFSRFGASARKPVERALLVFVAMFLVRLVLVGSGVAVVARAGESAVAFVVAFFVPYFVFTAIEGSFVHALGRGMGKPA